jgi:NAD(P)-dependent dehydrogenase (short-subunit alcohol dehydrogenase family)
VSFGETFFSFPQFKEFLFADLVKKPNKVAVMTGGNRGIGLYVIDKLLKCEMTVLLGVRNPEASKKNVEKVLGAALTRDRVFYEKCDTGDMESVREFAKKVQGRYKAIHLLINNGENTLITLTLAMSSFLLILAGVMCSPYVETKDGFESQMAINHLGHFMLTHLLMPQLVAGSQDNDGKNVRIVNVSSCVHRITDIDYDDFHCK